MSTNALPLISIIMPVKDAALYLNECIVSIENQGLENWELIAVNDNSVDLSKDILLRFSNKNPRINVLDNDGVGIIAALTLAFKNSKGRFIHRMDADDVMPKDKLAILFKTLNNQERTVATGKVQYFSNELISEGYLRYEKWINTCEYKKDIYRECVVASPNWLVHRSCFENDISIENLEYPEDYDMVLKWFKLGYEVVKSNQITHCWREHADRTSRNSDVYQQESFFRLKTKAFCTNELKVDETVQLIGAAVKGRLVCKLLQELDVAFSWHDLKSNYQFEGRIIQDLNSLNAKKKTILTNWPISIEGQNEIQEFLKEKGFTFGQNLWLF